MGSYRRYGGIVKVATLTRDGFQFLSVLIQFWYQIYLTGEKGLGREATRDSSPPAKPSEANSTAP